MSELFGAVLADLAAETADLTGVLAGLAGRGAAGWSTPTPAVGWSIRDQVTHLAYFDRALALAGTEPDRFRAEAAAALATGPDFVDRIAGRYRDMSGPAALAWFRDERAGLLETLAGLDPAVRLPWYGPDMSPVSAATARLMETWAHGVDVTDALGLPPARTGRLRHVAHLGVATRVFSFTNRGLPAPAGAVRVELAGPDGQSWHWGPDGAAERVAGPALDFCLVVTQRRHPEVTALVTTGAGAAAWLRVAQAFAGPPGPGRPADTLG